MPAYAIVDSSLDYCYAMLTGMSEATCNKQQRAQNTLALVVTGANRRDHITYVLIKLHWLPIRARVTSKFGTPIYKLLSSHQPSYLKVKVNDYTPDRAFHSFDMSLLAEPSHPPMSTIARRAFSYFAVKTWNIYPLTLGNRPL